MRPLVLLLITALSFASPRVNAGGQPGSFFLSSCEAVIRAQEGQHLPTEGMMGATFCAAYVSGFLDSMSNTPGAPDATGVCFPEPGVSDEQAIHALVKYLRENPKTLNRPGRTSLMPALKKAFPCKE